MHRTPPRTVHPAPGTCAPPWKPLRPISHPPYKKGVAGTPQAKGGRLGPDPCPLGLLHTTRASARVGACSEPVSVRRAPARPSVRAPTCPRPATGKDALCALGRSSPGAVRRHRRAAERAGPPRARGAAAPLRVLGRGERPGPRAPAARARAARTRGAHPGAAGRAGAASERVWSRLRGPGNGRPAPARPRQSGRGRPRDPPQPAGTCYPGGWPHSYRSPAGLGGCGRK